MRVEPDARRWPLADLEAKSGRVWLGAYAARTGTKVESARRLVCRVHAEFGGLLTTKEADEMAFAAGLHPIQVWVDWCEGPFVGCTQDDLFDWLAEVS